MPRPRFETRAAMRWDDDNFYIAARLEEPHIWAKLTEHDQIVYRDNDFEIFIDPDGDRQDYYEIEINAYGTIFDLLLKKTYRDGGPALHEWELVGMQSAVAVKGTLNDPSDIDREWTVEFALPWKSLAAYTNQPCPPKTGDTWRVNFSRVQWKHNVVPDSVKQNGTYEKIEGIPEDNWVWSPQGEINMHAPEHWGYVTFEN